MMRKLHINFQILCVFLGYLNLLTGFNIASYSEVEKKSKGWKTGIRFQR